MGGGGGGLAGLAGGLVGGVGGWIFGNEAANAEGKIAQAQMDEVNRRAQQAIGFAAPTAGELQTLKQQNDLYANMYARSKPIMDQQEKIIQQTYGKNIIAMGEELYKSVTGAESKYLKPVRDNIDRGREQLKQRLLDQLGPGAMTSSAGVAALNDYDRKATESLNQIQQQSISNLVNQMGGLQGGKSSELTDMMRFGQSLSGMLGQIQGTQDNFSKRQIGATLGVETEKLAGGQYAGDLARAKNNAQGMANAGQLISQAGGMAASGGMGGGTGVGSYLSTPQTQALDSFNGSMMSGSAGSQALPAQLNFGDLTGIMRS